jgi:hypothetical protein
MRNINAKSFDKMRFILNSILSRNFLMHKFLVEALEKNQAIRGGRSRPRRQPSEKLEDTSRINSRADFGG